MLKDQYKCPHFRILIIGRANAGKTTILRKICGVAEGVKPIIYDKNNILLESEPGAQKGVKLIMHIKHLLGKKPIPSTTPLTPSIEVSD